MGLGVGSVEEVLVEPGYQSGTSSLLVVELEVDELDVDEDELDVLELVEDVLDVDVLEVLSSGLSLPQPVRSAAARIVAKNTVFFIKYLLEAIIFLF